MANLNDQIGKINEQIKQLQNKKKTLLAKESEEKRKKRTKRLIEREAILESVIGNAEEFSNEQLQALLIEIFSSEFAKGKIKNFREHTATREIPCFNKGALMRKV